MNKRFYKASRKILYLPDSILRFCSHLLGNNKKRLLINLVHRNHYAMLESLCADLLLNTNIELKFTSTGSLEELVEIKKILDQFGLLHKFMEERNVIWKRWDVYIDLDYINFPVARPSKFIQVFHGNAGKNTSSGKNYSLNKKILNYDYLFCLSKEHVDLLQASNILKTPESAKLIGFIKLDDLVNQKYKRNDVLDFYKIDARLPTILYLPSYNQELSLNSLGLGLLNEITKLKCSFLIKLHPNSYKQIIPEKNITWGDYLDQISGHANIHHLNDQTAARYMAAGDILISDFGSSPTEFMTTGKPVIFYSDERANKLISDRNMLMMLEKSTLPFHSVSDCITQVEAMLKNPQVDESMKKNQEELIASRFYNPGSATQRARDAIIKILWG